ncbi:rhodanese-like domain-containing protein [Legionella oakridgensis]|uniref:Rhodanese-related sulfurtransferase n=2 Tax=Legionella oakridgensis TaxID=29423 RepID=W0BFV3_9GAMM|nr:rhodanese-like domain-containing protein [Legionella oakridgensis]AHE67581.1 rhodanese-related sulfurtransferase [Legionella oakridgensis ATCC 33761 = DSM 21215]ETO92824.1 rhodanese-related sulfurtransferase [Legionella oakridgensis RV-2-2007]KTD37070.1 rhodanese domain protein [Legionella oakridgensis]
MKQHSPRFLALVAQAKQRIQEITAEKLKEKMVAEEFFYLIDVREDHEWPSGHIPSARHLGKGIVERDIEKEIPDIHAPIVVYCSGGFRCALVADSLQNMGYSHVYSLEHGLRGWLDAGFSLEQ